MKTIRPDDGSSIRISKIYVRNMQAMQAFKFISDGEETVVELPFMLTTTPEGHAAELPLLTRTTIEWL